MKLLIGATVLVSHPVLEVERNNRSDRPIDFVSNPDRQPFAHTLRKILKPSKRLRRCTAALIGQQKKTVKMLEQRPRLTFSVPKLFTLGFFDLSLNTVFMKATKEHIDLSIKYNRVCEKTVRFSEVFVFQRILSNRSNFNVLEALLRNPTFEFL